MKVLLFSLIFSSYLFSQNLHLSLSSYVVVTNGLNFVILNLAPMANYNVPLSSWCNKESLTIISSLKADYSDPEIIAPKNNCQIKIYPSLSTAQDFIHDIQVIHQDTEYVMQLKTTIAPIQDKLKTKEYLGATQVIYGQDISYLRRDQASPGEFYAFQIENVGPNKIVSNNSMLRQYEFSFEDLSRQNLAMNVTDFPNDFTSQTMYSHFMFFPRTVLPHAVIDEQNQNIHVTLPNNEKILFSNSGEIIAGVFSEAPIDEYATKTKRKYAQLKYAGKGILLRANARGQLPQEGQFEKTQIDSQYGNSYSADVLIINGTTGQRCIRPKADFWSKHEIDSSTIAFKFATDEAFDQYLKKYCGFGIPEL